VSAALRLATRGSAQASTQARLVAESITVVTGRAVELVLVETAGDRRADAPLHTIGGQGVFVKEVQQAVLRGDADIAVHSAKDLPSAAHDGLSIGAFCARRSPADVLVGAALDALVQGATIATGSVRRRAQLARVRPDLVFAELRGNIHTRLSKVPRGGAIVMAEAALEILGLTDHVAEVLDPEQFVPAVGQGCVAVEHRSGDAATAELVAAVDDAPTRTAVETERAFLAELGSGCSLPVAAHAHDGRLHAFVADAQRRRWAADDVALADDPHAALDVARALARRLRDAVTS
jgi:hydroxymethylbilane synthase